MRVLITGGTGLIGSAIRRHLIGLNWQTVTVSRTGEIQAALENSDFVDRVVSSVNRCDVIIHCAASMKKGIHDFELSLVNGLGTQHIIAVAVRTQARHLVYLSSLPVIGRPCQTPVDEQHPTNPLTAYHASKLYGEHLVGLASSASLQTVSFRLSSPVGPGTPPGRIFSEFVMRARRHEPLVLAGHGRRRQDYVDVRDIAAAVAQSVSIGASGVFNIAAGKSVSNLQLANRCVGVLKSRSVISFSGIPDPDEDVDWEISIDKAHRSFGYKPAYDLDDSIQACAAGL